MRIGFDMLAVQSPHHGQQESGRSSRHLVSALLQGDDGHEYVLYAFDGLAREGIPESPRAKVRWLGEGADGLTVAQKIDRQCRQNPDGLDVLLVLNPFEHWSGYHPPGRRDAGPRLVALIHEMAPFLAASEPGYDPVRARQYRVLDELNRYDGLLTFSQRVRQDCLRLTGLSEDQVAAIGEARGDSTDELELAALASRVASLLEALPSRKRALDLPQAATARRRVRPRIAFFSPFPPRKSGVSDYSALLLDELKETYTTDLYHESGYVPEPALVDGALASCDARLFRRQAAMRDYHAVVYQMGNSRYHHFLYETLLRHPGVVTLHDFCLAGFHMMYGHAKGRERPFLRAELLRWYPEWADAIETLLDTSPWDREVIARECAERGWFLNRGVLAASERVIVHSPWCLDQVRRVAPEDAERIDVIPHGIWPRSLTGAERAAIRARFGIPEDALLFASFGFVHPDKMSPEALDVFQLVARSDPSALFMFAGEEADSGAVRRHAEALGILDRVRFLGRLAMSDFTDLIAATDVGINLRRPPTHGETSGALLYLLASGVATIVTDVATFTDYPDRTVWKVRWESDGLAGLERAVRSLAADRSAREALGRAAQAYTREHHDWSRVAKLYVDSIESSRDARAQRRGRDRGLSPAGEPRGARHATKILR